MNKVVLITGASSGIGLHTAKFFQAKNWKVAATMRQPESATELQKIVDIECLRLDVTDVESIKTAIAATLEKFGRIDAVVNMRVTASSEHLNWRRGSRSRSNLRRMSLD